MEKDSLHAYSCPDQPVRHNYPLAVNKDGVFSALSLCLKTWPFMLLRCGVLLAFTLGAIVWLAICAGVAALFSGKGGGGGGVILFLVGVGIPCAIFIWLKKYVLYLLKLGHVAALTELIVQGRIPGGLGQVAFGKEIVTSRFSETNILFVVDSLVTGVTRAFNGSLDWIVGLIPIPGLDGIMKLVNRIVDNATTYIDETIFSYNLARGDSNIWRSSLDGLVYYAQNVKAILKTALYALLVEYLLTFLIFVIMLVPAWIVSRILPASVSGYAWILAVVLALTVRTALLRPLFLSMVALTFHIQVQGQEINLSMADHLRSLSSKFEDLSAKAGALAQSQPNAA